MSEKDKLIEELSQRGLIEATEEQLREFLEKERNNEGYRI